MAEPALPPPSTPPDSPDGTSLVEWLLLGLGILLGLLGSILINVGNNVQALGMGMVAKQKEDEAKGAAPSKRPKRIWVAGTITFVVGSVINFVAFVFAPAAVLAPLEAIQFVSNLIFARCVTKVPVSRKMVGGSALIVCGTVGAVASGPLSVYSFSIPQLRAFWESAVWIAYVIVVWALSIGMQIFWELQTRRTKAGGKGCGPLALLPILYAVSSALIGTQSVVQAKAFSELMELWLSGETLIWVEWFTYIVLAYFGVTVAFWLYRLNAALGKYDPLFIIPLLQASYIVLATLSGGIYFQEFEGLAWWQLLAFFGCIGVMFVGLYLLMPPISGDPPAEPPPSQANSGGDTFLRLHHSVSFANTASFRTPRDSTPGTPRGAESASFYAGSGAGLSFHHGRRPSQMTPPQADLVMVSVFEENSTQAGKPPPPSAIASSELSGLSMPSNAGSLRSQRSITASGSNAPGRRVSADV